MKLSATTTANKRPRNQLCNYQLGTRINVHELDVAVIDESSLNAIRRIVANEIRRYAEEQAAAKAARPKQRV
jgi:hypothetical protein